MNSELFAQVKREDIDISCTEYVCADVVKNIIAGREDQRN